MKICGSTVAALTVMGGTFAVLPAYEADLYGSKYVGAIHGRFLTFGAAATVAGPMLLLNLRKMAEVNAINDLLAKVDPQLFLSKFGVSIADAPSLIEVDIQLISLYIILIHVHQAKTLTISKLMTIFFVLAFSIFLSSIAPALIAPWTWPLALKKEVFLLK